MKKFAISYWPLVFIIGLWAFFASPYLVKQQVPYPSKYQVTWFHPWSLYQVYQGPIRNSAMPDVVDQIYPWKYFSIQTYKQGIIPLWNPYSFSGNAHLANFQTAVLSPFNLVFFTLPFVHAWSILVLIQPLLAALFMYLFLRALPISKTGSTIGAVSFMFCGFMVVWMAYETLGMVIIFLPLVLYGIEKSFKKLQVSSLLIIPIGITTALLSGHFQTWLYLFLYTLGYFFIKIIQSRKTKETLFISLFLLCGILLAAPQLFPSIELYLNSVRSNIFIKGGGIPFFYLVNIFSPDFFGNPVTRNDWFGLYAEWASFIGIIPLFLVVSVIIKPSKKTIPFIVLGGLSLLLAVDSPLQTVISGIKIPVLSTSIPSRIIVLFSFSAAVLAGFGLDQLSTLLIYKKRKHILVPATLVLSLLVTIWILLLFGRVLPLEKLIIAKRNLYLPTLFFAVSCLLVFVGSINKKLITITIFCLLLLMSYDSLRFAQKWMPFEPPQYVFPKMQVIEAAQKNIEYGRIFGNLGAFVDTYYSLPSIEGYDPLYSGRYGEFIRNVGGGIYLETERSVVKIDRNGKYTNRVLDLLGVNIIFHPAPDTNQGWAYNVWSDTNRFSKLYQDSAYQLFKNNFALPRAELFYSYEVVQNNREILKKFYADNFDFKNKLILEKIPSVPSFTSPQKGSVYILSYKPDTVRIAVNTASPALLFLSDTFYPGWKAYIDNKESEIYRADYAFRAVSVPKGKHTIVFSYQPFSFILGIGVALGSLAIMGFSVILLKRKY